MKLLVTFGERLATARFNSERNIPWEGNEMFGRVIEGERVAYLGARAIYEGYKRDYFVDLLPDRQGGENVSDAFLFWLNNRAMPWLRATVKSQALGTDSNEALSLTEYKYHLCASPQGSYGYLYVGAVERPITENETWHNDAADRDERILETPDHRLIWGREIDPPEPGTRGTVTVNEIGPGVVIGYQDEKYACPTARLLNLRVKLDSPPQWWIDQTTRRSLAEWLAVGGGMGWLKASVQDRLLQIQERPRLIHACENTASCAPSKVFQRGEGMQAYRAWRDAYELPPAIIWDADFRRDDGTS